MAFWDHWKETNPRQEKETYPCEDQTFVPRYQPKKINVFVSSTFKDMKAERDELTLRVFPALRKVCEDRGISWGEVDLRWGIPEERKGEVLRTCLKFIDDCRPFFIGMLGERYGWVEESISEMFFPEHPWIREHQGTSITELEILHGVLNNLAMANHAYFYFRDPTYIDTLSEDKRPEYLEYSTDDEIAKYGEFEAKTRADIRKDRLIALKKRIKESGLPLRENYKDPIEFGKFVKEDLMRVIDSLAPPLEAPPLSDAERANVALDHEEIAHEVFAASRFGVYIPRQEYFDCLDAHADGTSPPLVILGESGCGKSALLAHWAFRYRSHHPEDFVLIHFIGASSESTDLTSMLRRFMREFKRKFSITAEIPERDGDLIVAFANWINMASAHGRVVLVIDALNQLEDRNGAPDLIWLPPRIPDNVRLIVSTLPGRPLDAIRKRGWPEMIVDPLIISERKALITCYLKRYHKELSKGLKEELASAPQCQNPLYLRALLEEVRVHGVYEKIPDLIKEYIEAKTVDGLYEKILKGYENDYDRDRPGLVKDTVSLIWAARRGLSKPELMDLLGTNGSPLPDAYWAPLYLAMEHSLVEKDGRITFFHDYFRAAVKHRYLGLEEQEREVHLKIANYFALQPDGIQKTEEFPWQLAEAAEWKQLAGLLTDPSFFLQIWLAREPDIKRYWVQVETHSQFRMVEVYGAVLRRPEIFFPIFVDKLQLLFRETGHLNESRLLLAYLIKFLREQGDTKNLQRMLGHHAQIMQIHGNLKGALALLKEQERIFRKLGNINDLAASLGNQASILNDLGDLDGAIILNKEAERLNRELGNRDWLQSCLCNQSIFLTERGDFNGGIPLLLEAEHICRELGNVDGLQLCLGEQGSICYAKGDLDNAMILYKEKERICREIGNLNHLQLCLGNQAVILQDRGDLEGAMVLHKEEEAICREMRNLKSLQHSICNQGRILQKRNDLNGAMVLNKEAERICRELGLINELQKSLGNQANILIELKDFYTALTILKEQEQICRERGYLDGLLVCLDAQSKIFYSQGDLHGSIVILKELERICREKENSEGLQACLEKQAKIFVHYGQFETGLALLKEQERIFREEGNAKGLQHNLGLQALILSEQGNLDGAMTCQKEKEQICRKSGNITGLHHSLGHQAEILYSRGDLDGAKALLKEQEQICREKENFDGLQECLGKQAKIFVHHGQVETASALLKEQQRICRELGNLGDLIPSLEIQAIIHHDRGDLVGSLNILKEQEQIFRELSNNEGLQHTLGHQALILKDRGDFNGAMVLLKEKERICREIGKHDSLVRSLSNQAIIFWQQNQINEAISAIEEASNTATHHGYHDLVIQLQPIREKIKKIKK